ncbi:MAG: hypothetical protein MZV65_01355 [Chromatiales bacterium]|nr:hypothetical protein [Chromatiales bacterium]
MTDYTVRVEVCKIGLEEPNCQAYSGASARSPPDCCTSTAKVMACSSA